VHEIYGADMARERFRHRYEFNNLYKETLEEAGMVFSGTTPDQRIMQILEYPQHPFFIATQFHPEWLSRPHKPHPLILAFIRAVVRHQVT
jgi:CTP synthase